MGSSEPAADVSATAPIGEVVVEPPTQDENLLYTRTNKSCVFQDSAELAWRIRQLEIINWAVQVLSKELCRPVDQINYKWVANTAMVYEDVDGHTTDDHDWSIVSRDSTFTGPME